MMINYITQGIELVLPHHKNSIKRALLDLFPSIGLDSSKFQFKSKEPPITFCRIFVIIRSFSPQALILCYLASPWNEIDTRRKFFESYAEENRFDPKSAVDWYIQPRNKLMACKVYYLSRLLSSLPRLAPPSPSSFY